MRHLTQLSQPFPYCHHAHRCDGVIEEYARTATAVCCAWGALTNKVNKRKVGVSLSE